MVMIQTQTPWLALSPGAVGRLIPNARMQQSTRSQSHFYIDGSLSQILHLALV